MPVMLSMAESTNCQTMCVRPSWLARLVSQASPPASLNRTRQPSQLRRGSCPVSHPRRWPLAVELAPERIRVNAVCPVIGETALLETFMGVADTPENRRAFEATIPLGRFSRPEDIARATLFLAGDDAEFIPGVTLEVDGGRCV